MRVVNLQLQSICFFLSTSIKAFCIPKSIYNPPKLCFRRERTNKGFTILCDHVIFLSLFPMSSHIFTLDVPSFFICPFSSSSSLLVFNFQSCVNQVQSFCVMQRSQVELSENQKWYLMRSLHLPNLKPEN